MAKYFMLWEVDPGRAPLDPKERGAAWLGMTSMVKQDIKDGKLTDWGIFVAQNSGYAVATMTSLELSKNLQRYYPYVTFKVNEVNSVDQAAEVAKSLTV
jgi:hypothetical protein